jgi:uncharacterized phage protein gp47/JayE
VAAGSQATLACGCCQAPGPAAPLPIFNRPGLSAIAYRTGDYAAFRQAMLQAIPKVDAELARALGLEQLPLGRWTARQPDDYGIALLELWAVLGDILTFYQERIANEAYLRTARQRDSIRRLAAMLDYRLDPGVAAATVLAYTLDAGATVQVPVGLRAQSVPGQDETPQVFETVEAITARDVLNRVRVHGKPQDDDPLKETRESGTLAAGSPVPAAGDRLLLYPAFPRTTPAPEEKVVERVEEVEGRTVLSWLPPVTDTAWDGTIGRLAGYQRTFRVFGSDAPSNFLVPILNDKSEIIRWESRTLDVDDYKLPHDPKLPKELPLDGIHDLVVGTRVVVRAGGEGHQRKVTAVEQKALSLGPLGGTVTVITLDTAPPAVDRRTVVVYELATDDLAFQNWAVPPEITTDSEVLYADLAALPAVEAGRTILVDDDAADGGPPVPLTVDGDAKEIGQGQPGHGVFLEIPIRPPLPRDLDAATAHLLGNVAAATHGETVRDEVVGSGDGSAAFQAFTLAKQPLTRVRSAAAPGGAQGTLSFRADQVEWQEVASLHGQPPAARVYTTDVDDEGRTTVRTGDGVTGARLPSGVNNLTATYRHGLGRAGILDPDRIIVALDRPPGLLSVTNPLPADGGDDPESTSLARRNAPNTVRAFDRAISLRDFEDLASGFAGVAKVKATSIPGVEPPLVHLTVAGPDGAKLSDSHRKDLHEYLDQRRDPNRAVLVVDNYQEILVTVEATVQADPARPNPAAETAARDAVKALFAFDTMEFGEPVHLSDVFAALQAAEGVVAADVDRLAYAPPTTAPAGLGPVPAHLPIAAATVTGTPAEVKPAELAVLAEPAVLGVTAKGGLPS